MFCKKRCFRKIHKKTPVTETLWHKCFPVYFAKFQRTPFLQNTSGQLLLRAITVVAYEITTSQMTIFVMTTFSVIYFRDSTCKMAGSIMVDTAVATKILLYGS